MTDFACTDYPELLSVEHDSEGAFVTYDGAKVRLAGHPVVSSSVLIYTPEPTWRVSVEPPGVRFPDGSWIDADYGSAVRSLTSIGKAGWLAPGDTPSKPDLAWRVVPEDFRMDAGKVYDFIYGVRDGVTYRWVREVPPPEPTEAALTWDDHDGIGGDD